MDEQIREIIEELFQIDFMDGVISNPSKEESATKVKIRPMLLKDTLKFQLTTYLGKQVFHKNVSKEEWILACENWFSKENLRFRQAQFHT